MSQADQIRSFVMQNHIAPAIEDGQTEVTIRAGDVHRAMGLSNAMPAVCSAVGGSAFKSLAGLVLLERQGPKNGANVYFRFALGPDESPCAPANIKQERHASARARPGDLNFDQALVLVSCVKRKLPRAAAARSLYTSDWFTKVRGLVEESGAPWFVLSALYGLVENTSEISPYDYTLKGLGVAERKAWASKVLKDLIPIAVGHQRVIIFAGVSYREFLMDPLQRIGVSVEVPMANLSIGQQLGWLAQRA